MSTSGPLQLDRVDDKDASCTPPCSPLGGTWEKSFFLGSGPGSAIPWASDDEESMFPLLPGHPPRRATGAGHAPDEFVVPPMTPPAGGDTHAVTFSVAELEEASVEALNGSAEGGLTPLPWAPDDPLLPGQPPWRAAGVDGSAEGGLTPLPGVDTDDFFYPLKGAGKEEKPGSAAQEAVAEVSGFRIRASWSRVHVQSVAASAGRRSSCADGAHRPGGWGDRLHRAPPEGGGWACHYHPKGPFRSQGRAAAGAR